MEMPWVKRETLASRMHKIDTGILTGCAGMHNFNQVFSLRFEYFEDSYLKFQDNKKTVQKISKKDFERKTGNKKNIFFLSKIK